MRINKKSISFGKRGSSINISSKGISYRSIFGGRQTIPFPKNETSTQTLIDDRNRIAYPLSKFLLKIIVAIIFWVIVYYSI